MKYLKLFILLTIFLFLPVTIYAGISKVQSCATGFKKNAQNICEEIKAPANGRLNSFKDDFECDRGYTKNFKNWSCDPITIPENGVLTLAGDDWTCIANYKKQDNQCIRVVLPDNAHFEVKGPDWYCNSGYQKQNDQCIKIELPSNAQLTYSGNNWECNKGFTKSSDNKSCEEVKIPENASSNYIGTFTCNSGYKTVGDHCEKVPDIQNGRFYTTGADFYCLNGYQKNESNGTCDKIEIPQNAKADSADLDGWICYGGYIKEGNECKTFTLPEHALWTGNTWTCEQGYKKNSDQKICEKITIPENAHSVDTFDGWLCNSGYTKNYRDNRCDLTKESTSP